MGGQAVLDTGLIDPWRNVAFIKHFSFISPTHLHSTQKIDKKDENLSNMSENFSVIV